MVCLFEKLSTNQRPRVRSWPCCLHESEIRGQGNQRFFSLSSSLLQLVVAASRLAVDLFREEKSWKTSGTRVLIACSKNGVKSSERTLSERVRNLFCKYKHIILDLAAKKMWTEDEKGNSAIIVAIHVFVFFRGLRAIQHYLQSAVLWWRAQCAFRGTPEHVCTAQEAWQTFFSFQHHEKRTPLDSFRYYNTATTLQI